MPVTYGPHISQVENEEIKASRYEQHPTLRQHGILQCHSQGYSQM